MIDGVPIFLLDEAVQTIGIANASLKAARETNGDPLFLETLGLSESEKSAIAARWTANAPVDAVVSYLVGATSGLGYLDAIGRLTSYPIPEIPLDEGEGRWLLDIGSNWGRWSVSAARKGWNVFGIDPSLGAIMAATRAFPELAARLNFVCGDARFLPFALESFDAVFSYSVLQHFSEDDASAAISETGRVLKKGARAKIQMAHRGGFRSRHHLRRPDYLDDGPFRVRYWSLKSLADVFASRVGPSTLTPEAFGGLGLLAEDRGIVNAKARILIDVSSRLKRLAKVVPSLIAVADSVYVDSIKR